MRLLTDDELDLVAGGTSSSDFYENGSGGVDGHGGGYGGGGGAGGFWYWQFVPGSVTADPDGTPVITGNGGYWAYQPGTGGGGGGSGGGGGGSPLQNADHQQTEDANDTPCVDELPAGMDINDLNHLNDLAKFSARQIAALQDSTGHEWGVIIYRGTDGQLYQSDPFTAGHPHDMNGARATLPSGAVVVGYLHTHPIDETMDERNLSGDDVDFIRALIENGGTNVTADPNMLAYVVTMDEEASYKTYVYDKSKRTSDMPGCKL